MPSPKCRTSLFVRGLSPTHSTSRIILLRAERFACAVAPPAVLLSGAAAAAFSSPRPSRDSRHAAAASQSRLTATIFPSSPAPPPPEPRLVLQKSHHIRRLLLPVAVSCRMPPPSPLRRARRRLRGPLRRVAPPQGSLLFSPPGLRSSSHAASPEPARRGDVWLQHSPKDSRVSVDVYDENGVGGGASGVSGGLLHPYSPKGILHQLQAFQSVVPLNFALHMSYANSFCFQHKLGTHMSFLLNCSQASLEGS